MTTRNPRPKGRKAPPPPTPHPIWTPDEHLAWTLTEGRGKLSHIEIHHGRGCPGATHHGRGCVCDPRVFVRDADWNLIAEVRG